MKLKSPKYSMSAGSGLPRKSFDLRGYTSAIVDMGSIPPVAGVRPWGPLFQRTQNPISLHRGAACA